MMKDFSRSSGTSEFSNYLGYIMKISNFDSLGVNKEFGILNFMFWQ